MKNLKPFLSVNWSPGVSEPVSKVPYDIIKVAKSKILPVVHGPAGWQKSKKIGVFNSGCS